MTTAFTVIIPSRYASTRLPGKPLRFIGNKPMIQLVWEQTCKSGAERILVATDDQRIIEVCKGFGAEAVLTLEDHNSGTDRLAEVAVQLGLAADAIVVNVQVDEPLIPPCLIDQVAANLEAYGEARIATLAEPIKDIDTLFSPNVVKVVSDTNGLALTFSRSILPWSRDCFIKNLDVLPKGVLYRRHIGIYAYRAGFLYDFINWSPCWLEKTESLEQLRALWYGVRIHVDDALETLPAGVDTKEDLERIRCLLWQAR
ncbi:3-deoxy-manno-octulosonate cytidylyltransferase [Candidatus Pseudomonas adelgestsugas]|uniref:3-deoxy-manno-octulosonate cytidylyltransferase n=1 Tax=Candidatus Pseudomonas adelgestsugas TaxID=1302376 RepID=A0ABX5R832_9PSED|nr:3-deoxy-manno-octulosonate cytidylyltransferase [Candidatus Pseudomonas adelgestsugas]QAX81807.1 3-deoxy-manno-octulosonate cytidylyltransferase [Candidatus Pseudomonas adelgestsugas]